MSILQNCMDFIWGKIRSHDGRCEEKNMITICAATDSVLQVSKFYKTSSICYRDMLIIFPSVLYFKSYSEGNNFQHKVHWSQFKTWVVSLLLAQVRMDSDRACNTQGVSLDFNHIGCFQWISSDVKDFLDRCYVEAFLLGLETHTRRACWTQIDTLEILFPFCSLGSALNWEKKHNYLQITPLDIVNKCQYKKKSLPCPTYLCVSRPDVKLFLRQVALIWSLWRP